MCKLEFLNLGDWSCSSYPIISLGIKFFYISNSYVRKSISYILTLGTVMALSGSRSERRPFQTHSHYGLYC